MAPVGSRQSTSANEKPLPKAALLACDLTAPLSRDGSWWSVSFEIAARRDGGVGGAPAPSSPCQSNAVVPINSPRLRLLSFSMVLFPFPGSTPSWGAGPSSARQSKCRRHSLTRPCLLLLLHPPPRSRFSTPVPWRMHRWLSCCVVVRRACSKGYTRLLSSKPDSWDYKESKRPLTSGGMKRASYWNGTGTLGSRTW